MLTMLDVLQSYGFRLNKNKTICCPFHNEKTPSFKTYKDDTRYHCFGCDADGDIITFTMLYFGLDFNSALEKLNDDFNLGLIKSRKQFTRREMLKAMEEKRQREAGRKAYETERERLENNYWVAFDEWKKYDDNKRIYKPKSADEELNPLFVEALKNIGYAEYKLDIADIGRRVFEKCRKT